MVSRTQRSPRTGSPFALLLLTALCLPAGTAHGAEGPGDAVPRPSVAEWRRAPEALDAAGAFPRVVAFVTELPEDAGDVPEFLPVDAAAFQAASYLRAADARSAAWDYALNAAKLAKMAAAEAVRTITGADTIVVAPSKGPWRILWSGKSGATEETVATAPRPKTTDAPALAAWVQTTLGWDGVVLARRGPFLLVGSTAAILATPGAQALAVAASAERFHLTSDSRQGAGLLSLTESAAGYGVFDVVFLGEDGADIPIGAKLTIERKR